MVYYRYVVKRKELMKLSELPKHVTLYEIAKVLGVTAPATYKWKKTGVIPKLRVFELKEKKPEWFTKEQK